jgi:hypothetical protein
MGCKSTEQKPKYEEKNTQIHHTCARRAANRNQMGAQHKATKKTNQ